MLKTKRLELVGFDVKYANDLFELWSDFEVIKFTFTPLMTTIDECINYIEHQISRTNKDFIDRFVILLNNKAIGMVGCICMDKENYVFGLYYQISRVYWGCGYASEAASAILQYVLDAYPNAIFRAEAVSENSASAAVLKKIGLKQTHIEKNGFMRNDFELDLIHYTNA
ncbi:GNAT family N-acetyltransferase [Anaerosporobacter faecicola]|uniref:GNAT family N-acetyltransferase n=1 Tax=Anaerosporobacter faecicola TaxID=2718714 RepID=UPI00143C8DA0|nr:GNAT family N-acetyltransferase [Anaerosporobacter faecicola]